MTLQKSLCWLQMLEFALMRQVNDDNRGWLFYLWLNNNNKISHYHGFQFQPAYTKSQNRINSSDFICSGLAPGTGFEPAT